MSKQRGWPSIEDATAAAQDAAKNGLWVTAIKIDNPYAMQKHDADPEWVIDLRDDQSETTVTSREEIEDFMRVSQHCAHPVIELSQLPSDDVVVRCGVCGQRVDPQRQSCWLFQQATTTLLQARTILRDASLTDLKQAREREENTSHE